MIPREIPTDSGILCMILIIPGDSRMIPSDSRMIRVIPIDSCMIPSDSLDSHSDSLIMADNPLEEGTEDISVLNCIERSVSVLCNDG